MPMWGMLENEAQRWNIYVAKLLSHGAQIPECVQHDGMCNMQWAAHHIQPSSGGAMSSGGSSAAGLGPSSANSSAASGSEASIA